MPRGVQSGIQPTEDACSGNGAPAAGPVPAAPAEEDESYEVSSLVLQICIFVARLFFYTISGMCCSQREPREQCWPIRNHVWKAYTLGRCCWDAS